MEEEVCHIKCTGIDLLQLIKLYKLLIDKERNSGTFSRTKYVDSPKVYLTQHTLTRCNVVRSILAASDELKCNISTNEAEIGREGG